MIYTVLTEGLTSEDRDRFDESLWGFSDSSNDRRAFAIRFGELR